MNPFSFQEQPVLQNILATQDVISCDSVNYFYVGLLPFNTSEIHTNNLNTVFFIPLLVTFYNGEGVARGISFVNVGGTNKWYTGPTIASLLSYYYSFSSVFPPFARCGIGLGGGNVGGATTVITFSGYRVVTN